MNVFYSHYKDYPMDRWHWDNFTPREMACKGTGKLLIDLPSMDLLQELRETIGLPFHINSAYRSPEHNRAEGGATQSQHLLAKAFDINLSNLVRGNITQGAEGIGFNGIGQYNSFIHIDTRDWYDKITLVATITDVFEKRRGAFKFMVEETVATNQLGQLTTRFRQTVVERA